MTEAWRSLLRSRKFLILLLDTAISIALYFGSKYLAEGAFADVKFLIGALQVPALAVIYAITREDTVALSAGVHPRSRKETGA